MRLLLAKDNVWLFYNAFDLNDGEVRDPSSAGAGICAAFGLDRPKHPDELASSRLNLTWCRNSRSQLNWPLSGLHTLQPFDPLGFSRQNV